MVWEILKRQAMKKLIRELRNEYQNVDMNIFSSTNNVNLETLISYHDDEKMHNFLENY